jgi:hypothetical protein
VSLHADRSACKPIIRGELISSNFCEAAGLTATGPTPVLALCRELLAAGFDRRQPLHAYRGDKVALYVRSIGEGARLAVEDSKLGRPTFRRWRDRQARDGAAPPIAPLVPEGVS